MANNESWNYAHNLTAKIEGGIASTKKDKGNQNKVAGVTMYSKTYYGLTLQAYASMNGLKYPPASKEDFKKLNSRFVKEFGGTTEKPVSAKDGKNKVKSLFKKTYWDKHKLGEIKDKRVAASIYDALVNQGWSFGDKGQRNSSMLGALKRLGIDTSAGFKGLDDAIAQVNSAIELKGGDAVLDSYAQSRENSYITSSNDPDNPDRKEASRGWMNRLNDHRTDMSKVSWEKLPKNTALSKESIKKVRRDKNYNTNTATTLSEGELQEKGLKEEYEKYSNELGSEGDEMAGEVKILSYEEWYKNLDNIGSPRAQKLKRDSLKDLGPRVEKVKEKEEKVEEGVVGKVDEDGNLILAPTPIAPGTTISDEGEVDFGGQIEKQKKELKKKKEEENKNKEKVYQPKELVPLGDLTEEEINNLTDEERKEYGLQPTVEVAVDRDEEEELTEEQLAVIEEERLRGEKEKAEDEKYVEEQRLKREEEERKRRQKKGGGKVLDQDGDGIPDTIDADGGVPTVPENQLTVSTEEKEVIEEQEKEVIETVQTEEIVVLDANGNIKKITVPTVETPTTVETEGVETLEKVVEEKPELVKPKLKDFKTSSDYMKARRQYFKSVEDDDALDFENELDDDEIKEVVDMEQNSTFIDASKRNIFKTNGKSNIFNSVIGNIDNLAKGIQQELNNITKSINNRD